MNAPMDRKSIEQKIRLLEHRKCAMEARDSLLAFSRYMNPDPDKPDDPTASRYSVQPHHKLIAEAIEELEAGRIMRVALSIPPQHGKLIAHSELVLTPGGFVRHGDLRPGDLVYGSDGMPVQVVAISEDGIADYEVEFCDGEIVRVHGKHEWAVHVCDEAGRPLRVLETEEMERRGVRCGTSGRGGRWRFAVDWVRVVGAEAELPIEPYALGAWLGDGASSKAELSFAHEDRAVADGVGQAYPIGAEWSHKTTGVGYATFGGGLRTLLRVHGLLNNKHIPGAYFTSSIAQRQRLLAGLMDTDGYVHHRTRRACFSTCSARLADDVATLVRTLGMRATVAEFAPVMSSSRIQGRKPVYQVTFSPSESIPCLLERKRVDGFAVAYRRRGIKAIRRCAPLSGRCIQVDAEDGVYLVGRGLVPTHNSQLTSRNGPAWIAGRNPWKNFIIGTYSQDFANEFGADVRNLMLDPRYEHVFPETKLRTDSKSKEHMVTTKGGKLSFVGRGGTGTGRPADGIFIDDYLKNRQEADSLAVRNECWGWFTSVMNSRAHGLTFMIIVATRWSEDDIIGRLTDSRNKHYKESVARQWTVINVPAIQDDPEIAATLGKKVGDALWPERFPLPLLTTAKEMDPLTFSALYQGKPTPPEGAFYKRDDIHTYGSVDELPKNLAYYGGGDLAVSPERNADSSVVGTAGIDEDDVIWILPNLYWEKKSADESVEQIIDFAKEYGWHDSFWEKGQLARAVGPFLETRARERNVPLNMQMFPASGSKGARSTAIRGRMRQGKVRFPSFASWWERALDQMLKFTGTGQDPEDDFCDFIAMIGQGLELQIGAGAKTEQQKIVRVGSLAWVKAAADRERKREKRFKNIAGM